MGKKSMTYTYKRYDSISWGRYLAMSLLVTPMVLWLTACGGGTTAPIDNSRQQFINDNTKCLAWQQEQKVTAGEVDVLFVVDNSGSMYRDQAALGVGMTNLGNALVGLGIDNFHLGFVTTDMVSANQSGKLQTLEDGSKYITSAANMAAFYNSFIDDPANPTDVYIGSSGAGSETGGAAALAAMTTQAQPGGPNDGFFRANSTKAVVILTDEDDDTIPDNGTAAAAIDTLINNLIAAVPADKLYLHLIAHTVADGDIRTAAEGDPCYNNGTPASGDEFADQYFLEQENLQSKRSDGYLGQRIDICHPENYANVVPQLVFESTVFTPTRFVDLNKLGLTEVDPRTIHLSVGGVEVPNDPSNFTYDPDTNIITFISPLLTAPGTSGQFCATERLGEV